MATKPAPASSASWRSRICASISTADYAVALKKTPPFAGALKAAWKSGRVSYGDRALNDVVAGEDEALITALAAGHHRTRRGVYDLLFRALKACGLDRRNP